MTVTLDWPHELCSLGDELTRELQELLGEFTDRQPEKMIALQTVLWAIARVTSVALSALDEEDRRAARNALVELIDFHTAEQIRHDKAHGTRVGAVKRPLPPRGRLQ